MYILYKYLFIVMYFFWPEKYRGVDDFEIDKMLQIVEDRKRALVENLNINRKLENVPSDLLTIYAIYDVFSVENDEVEKARKWFIDRYKGRLVYYLENKKFLPEYSKFVWKLFHDLLDIKLKKTIEQFDFDWYFLGNNDIKLSINDHGKWEIVKSWDEFKKVLIKMSRELFPNAENRLNRLLDTKNFKKEIVDSFFEKEKEELLWMLSESIDRDKKSVDESRQKQKEVIKEQIQETGESEELLWMLDMIENWEWNIFIEMDWMVKMLSIFDLDDFDLRYEFLQFYVSEVLNRFKVSSDKRSFDNDKNSDVVKKEDNQKEKDEISSIVIWEWVKKISDEKNQIINLIAENSSLYGKTLKCFKNYLRRLCINWKDCRMSSLKNKFGIEEIDENMRDLFEKLWIGIRYDVLKQEKKKEQIEVKENKGEDEIVIESLDDVESLEKLESLEIILDPFDIFKQQVDKYDYKVSNEKKLKKQFEYLCSTDASLTQILWVEMRKSSFWIPKKKQGKNYYTIEVAVTWLRFLLFKCSDGKFIVDWLYSHDDYDKRVKEL